MAPACSFPVRNLSFNHLRKWTVVKGTLLRDLDVTGNQGWLPNEHLTHFKELKTVRGVTWNAHCKRCLLVKVQTNSSPPNFPPCQGNNPGLQRLTTPAGWVWHNHIKYGQAFDFIKAGFWPTCLICVPTCFYNELELPRVLAQFSVFSRAISSLYATGSVVIVLNVAVLVFVAYHRRLRNNLAILLMCNIAACDVLIGVFSVIFARFNGPNTVVDDLTNILEGRFDQSDVRARIRLRNAIGTILTCAVTAQIWGGLVMTLEKFFKIVFVMSPGLRIEKNFAIVLLISSWLFSLLFAIFPVFNVGGMTYLSLTMATPLPSDQFTLERGQVKLQTSMAAGIQIVLFIVQLVTLILHLSIFVAVKKSQVTVGVKREARTARKIALLVLTNFVTFTIPMMFGVLQDDLWQNVFVAAFPKWHTLTLTDIQWVLFVLHALPALCFSMNSILNPIIYALRHPMIKQHLRNNTVSALQS